MKAPLLLSLLSFLIAAPATASAFYAWVYAQEFCEMLSYGLSTTVAASRAQKVVDENSIYSEEESRDKEVRLPNGYTLSATRKLNKVRQTCPQLMK